WIGAAVMSAGMSLASPTPMAWAADATPTSRHGVTLSVARTAGDVGSFVGPFALAGVAIAATLGAALFTNGVALLLLAGAALATGLRHRPAAPATIAEDPPPTTEDTEPAAPAAAGDPAAPADPGSRT